ncbi:ABC transporter permease [Shewanella vesiculosa]|uniref:ABC transporter permease n=1 Tax=Shewanella vesiculosa TaxID=518738 RepID=UPI000F4E95E0|nr:ABC transporter permease [Shewanella vesiculosa]RPA56251.1 ABC transporter permease [Shewanella vesiculosa]UJL42271.1 ABC transporter permease [Shewanella vesiculosa]
MNFWQLMVAECKAILADKAIVVTLFGGVLFYSVLYPLPYLHQVPTEQQIVVVDHDNSSLSRLVTRHADASAKIKVLANVNSIDQAQAWIDAGKAHGLLVIPADFRRNLLLGKGATLSYGGDASYFLIYSAIVEGLVSAGIDASKHVQMIGLLARGQNPELAQQAVNSIHINSVPAFNPSLGYTPYVVPGLFLLILHQTLLIGTGILGAGQWGKQGYWQQVRPVTLVLARLSVFMMIYALFSSFYLGACFYWYKVSVVASVIEVGLFMLPFLLATGSLGIYLSSLFRRRELPTQLYLLVSMPILFVSGFVWPIALIPQPLVVASQVIPAVPAIMGMLELNQLGAGWLAVLPKWLQLWGLFAVFVTMAIVAIARKQQDVKTPS